MGRKARPSNLTPHRGRQRLYSVPHALVGLVLDVTVNGYALGIMHEGPAVAITSRHGKSRFVTLTKHMPKAPSGPYKDWSPQRFLNWATGRTIGPRQLGVVQRPALRTAHQIHEHGLPRLVWDC